VIYDTLSDRLPPLSPESILSLGDTLVSVVTAPGGQQHNKHTDRLTALDNERVYRLNTLQLLQASVQLRQAGPHSCIRNCTPPVWSAAVQEQTAAAVLQQRIRYVHVHEFFVSSHTARQLQAHCCAISHRRPMRRESWAGWQPLATSTAAATAPTPALSPSPLYQTRLYCQLLTDSGCPHAGRGIRRTRPTSYARLKHVLWPSLAAHARYATQGSKSTVPTHATHRPCRRSPNHNATTRQS
jgi:hypothetical protein